MVMGIEFRKLIPRNVGIGCVAYGISEKEYFIAVIGAIPAWVAGIATATTYKMNSGEIYHN